MEEFSRRVLVALVVAAAGPGAALLTLFLVAPPLVAASTPGAGGDLVETTGSLLVGLLIGSMLSVPVAYAVGAAATLVALVTTRCPRPHLAWAVCLVLSPMWIAGLAMLDLDVTGFVVLCGVLPGAVRLGFGYREQSPASDPAARRA